MCLLALLACFILNRKKGCIKMGVLFDVACWNHKILFHPPKIYTGVTHLNTCHYVCDLKKKVNVCLFLRERETEHEHGRGRERGRHRIQSRLQALSCQRRARCRSWTHKLWDRDLSWSWTLNQLSHSGAPVIFFCKPFIGACSLWTKHFLFLIIIELKCLVPR